MKSASKSFTWHGRKHIYNLEVSSTYRRYVWGLGLFAYASVIPSVDAYKLIGVDIKLGPFVITIFCDRYLRDLECQG